MKVPILISVTSTEYTIALLISVTSTEDSIIDIVLRRVRQKKKLLFNKCHSTIEHYYKYQLIDWYRYPSGFA